MNQEDLAGRAKVSVRTIQRAEAGKSIDLQTAQQIATVLGVTPDVLRVDEDPEMAEPPSEMDLARIALRPIRSARALLDVTRGCDECTLDHDVDIGTDALDAVVKFCEVLDPYLPVLCPEIINFDGSSTKSGKVLIERLRLEAGLNASLEQLAMLQIGVFAGTYVDFMQRPRYDLDEGVWSTRRNQACEDVKFGIVRLGPASSQQLVARVKVAPLPF